MGERSVRMDVLSIYVPSFFIFLGMSIVSPILPLYAKSFNVSYTLVSLAISAYAFGRFLADIPTGILADKYGRRPLMIIGTFLLSVTAVLNAMAGSFAEFLLWRLLQGIGSSMWMTSRSTILADILKPSERGKIMGYFQAFMLLGSSAGPVVGGWIATKYGVKETFYFYALTGFISLIITYLWIQEPERTGVKHESHLNMETFKRLMSNRSFSLACLATFTVFFMRTGIRGTMIPLYADAELGLDAVSIGSVISYATIMNLILTMPMGHIIDYYGRKPAIVWSLSVTAISSLIFPMSTNYLAISVAAVVLGIGTSGAGQAPLALATDCTLDEPRGLCQGLYRLFGDIGFMVGPVFLGLIADNYGLRAPFYFMTVMIIISAITIQIYAVETYSEKKNKMLETAKRN